MQNKTNLPAVIQTAITDQHITLGEVNLLLPTETFGVILGEFDRVTIEIVRVNKDPREGDVFEVSKGKKAFTKRPLMAMSNALGIIWDPANTGLIESSARKARAKATGAMQKPNGEWVPKTEEKTVDLDAIEEEVRFNKEEDAEKGPIVKWEKTEEGKSYPVFGKWKDDEEKKAWLEREVRRTMIQYRKFKDERALTGAQERVVRWFLALKPTYTDKELEKPFAFPRVALDANRMLRDPVVRQAAIDRMTGSAAAIFGPGNGGHHERNITPQHTVVVESEEVPPEPPAPKEVESPDAEGEGETQGSRPAESDPFGDEEEESPPGPLVETKEILEQWMLSDLLSSSAKGRIRRALDEGVSHEELQVLLKLCNCLQDSVLRSEAKELIVASLGNPAVKLEALQNLVQRADEYKKRKAEKASVKGGAA